MAFVLIVPNISSSSEFLDFIKFSVNHNQASGSFLFLKHSKGIKSMWIPYVSLGFGKWIHSIYMQNEIHFMNELNTCKSHLNNMC